MSNQFQSPTPQNQISSGANSLVIIALAFVGLIGGGIAGIGIEVTIGLLTRYFRGLYFFHAVLAALPYLGALIGGLALPVIYAASVKRT